MMVNGTAKASSRVTSSISPGIGRSLALIVSVWLTEPRDYQADQAFTLECIVWEEVRGSHFYTMLSIHSALLRGSSLAIRLNDAGAAAFYSKEAKALVPVLEQFYDEQKGIVRVSLNQSTGRDSDENAHAGDSKYGKDSELDAAIVLGWLHAAEGTIWENDDRIAATLGRIVDAFRYVRDSAESPWLDWWHLDLTSSALCRPLYPITMDAEAPGIGRYPEDQYGETRTERSYASR